MILARSISVAFGLLAALATSQVPEFTQQYRQRLGGAVDELKSIVATFDADSVASGLTREGGLNRLRSHADGFVRARGSQIQETIARAGRLEMQQQQLAHAGPFNRVGVVLRDFDPGVARGAWSTFEPAVPASSEGIVAALIGFFAGGGLLHLLGWPFRRMGRAARMARGATG